MDLENYSHKRIAGIWVAILMVAGCAASPRKVATPTDGTEPLGHLDPCASRLHDISGSFLMYYMNNRKLPDSLNQLNQFPGMDPLEFVCPVSGKPYIYNPQGIMLPEKNAKIILYDPAPSHLNYREAIEVIDQGGGQALQTDVIILPESFFLLHPPQ